MITRFYGGMHMQSEVSSYTIFSEKIRGLATRVTVVSMDDVEELEDLFKRVLEDKELDPEKELRKIMEAHQ